jgi:hypothetical protein
MLAVVNEAIAAAHLPRPCVIPVTREQWLNALEDARLSERSATLITSSGELLSAAHCTDGRKAARDLQIASGVLAETLSSLREDLVLLSALKPAAGGLESFQNAAVKLATATASAAIRAPYPGTLDGELLAELDATQTQVRGSGPFVDDPLETALGLPLNELRDDHGVFSSARLLGAYRGRYDELQHQLHTVLLAVTDNPPDLLDALHPAGGLLLTDRPFLALKAAIAVKELFEQTLNSDSARLTPLRTLKLRVTRSAASHVGIVATNRAIREASTDAERAHLTLDLYRRMVESQLRPWAWTLLQVRGRSAPRPPELGPLRDLLQADGHLLLAEMAVAILPAARNAAAHEDYLWDDDKHVLAVGEDTVDIATLEDAIERAYSLMCGAECAWSCARWTSAKFAAILDATDPPGHLVAPLDEHAALSHFGTNGLLPRATQLSRATWTVTLEEIPFSLINPCFQALVWSAQLLRRANRFQVLLPGREQPVIDIQRSVLEANWLVWQHARATMESMPQSTFLPANAWTRLAVEVPESAAQAVAWLAANDAVDACEESEATDHPSGPRTDVMAIRGRAARLALRLEIIVTAIGATLTVLPADACGPLETVLETVEPAAYWAAWIAAGHMPGPLHTYIEQLYTFHAGWPVASVLPTLDPTPLDQLEA